MIVTVIIIASLLSGVLGSYDSLAKCLYEEEVADAQVRELRLNFACIHDSLRTGYSMEQGKL